MLDLPVIDRPWGHLTWMNLNWIELNELELIDYCWRTLNHEFEGEGGRSVVVGDGAGVVARVVGGGLFQFQGPFLLFGRAQVTFDGTAVFAPRDFRFGETYFKIQNSKFKIGRN